MSGGGNARERGLDAWIAFFEGLSVDRLDQLPDLATDDVRFKDPFNDVTGRDALRVVLAHTLASCDGLRFSVTHRAAAPDLAFLRWRFQASVPVVGALDVTGMSEIAQAPDGRVAAHIDHWDAGEHLYLRLPLLGPPLRLIRRRLAGPAGGGSTG